MHSEIAELARLEFLWKGKEELIFFPQCHILKHITLYFYKLYLWCFFNAMFFPPGVQGSPCTALGCRLGPASFQWPVVIGYFQRDVARLLPSLGCYKVTVALLPGHLES